MSWAEVKKINSDLSTPLNERQEPMYYNGKKVTKMNKFKIPGTISYKNVTYSMNHGISNQNARHPMAVYDPISNKLKTEVLGYQSNEYGDYDRALFEIDLTTRVSTVLAQESFTYSSKTSSPSADTLNTFLQDSQGNLHSYLPYASKCFKLNSSYIWLFLFASHGRDKYPYAAVTSSYTDCFTNKSSVPSHLATFTSMPLNNATFFDASYSFVQIHEIDEENNDFYYFQRVKAPYTGKYGGYTNIMEFYKGHVNDDSSITFTFILDFEYQETTSDNVLAFKSNPKIHPLSNNKCVIGDFMWENHIRRPLSSDEQMVFSNNDSKTKIIYDCDTHLLFKYTVGSSSASIRINSFYLNGETTWLNPSYPTSIANSVFESGYVYQSIYNISNTRNFNNIGYTGYDSSGKCFWVPHQDEYGKPDDVIYTLDKTVSNSLISSDASEIIIYETEE